MLLTKKGEILQYIKKNAPVRTKQISIKFGNGGYIWNLIAQLEFDKEISRPKRGYWKCIK